MKGMDEAKEVNLKARSILWLIVFLLVLSPLAFSQSKDTGSIEGIVMDQEKAPLPGVTVTISSPNLMGTRTSVTDATGVYRFPALPPGTYQVKAQLVGFKTFVQENIRVQTTMRLAVDVTMIQSAVEEEVTVMAQSPTVDVKSTETASVTLSNDILRNIPYNQFTANIVNLAPGVNENVAYGAAQDTGVSYAMDGVGVGDPEAGSAWVFVDHNIIEEAKVMALGLPAEYGNFTGVIFNLVTKSGGNTFSGHFEADFEGKKGDFPKSLWQADNTQAYLTDFPDYTGPLTKLFDISGHLGGPIIKDKLWFYTGVQYYRSQDWVVGFPEPRDYKQPRWFGKLSAQFSPSTPMTFSLEIDTYLGKNRGYGATHTVGTTLNQTSPEVVGNFSLTHIFSPTTFLDVKASGFWGYYYLEPAQGRNVNAHFDNNIYKWVDNFRYYYLADRARGQLNASVSHYADDFIQGSHDFKFGVEMEYSWARSRYGYSGANNTWYSDYPQYAGYPGYGPQGQYLAYQYKGYDVNSRYLRLEAFAQDSWQITPRLNINLGLRLSNNWGFVKGVSGSVFHTMRLAPRIGFTFDILGDKTTIFKAHYGQFTEGMYTSIFDRLNPSSAFNTWYLWAWDNATNKFDIPIDSVPPPSYQLDPNIGHPYMNQFTASVERELFKDASITVTGIYREWKNFLFHYDKATTWTPLQYYIPEMGQSITVYERTSDIDSHDRWVQNSLPGQNPYRRYWGIEFLFNKRFSNRWQVMASYVYSKAYGTMDNSFGQDIGAWTASADNPNNWINADGNSTYDMTHMLKVQATYLMPFGIYFNAYVKGITGDAWTTLFRPTAFPGRTTVFAEQRGSHHYPIAWDLDLRLEKTFMLAEKYRLGLILDVFNVFNANTIDYWGTQYGSGSDWLSATDPDYTPSTSGHLLYDIVNPRQARVGIRLIF